MDGSDLKSVRTQRSISLVIPAWNEEAGILQAITEADLALSKIATNYEILVVDDGSGDGTAAIVTTAGSVFSSLRLLRHPRNRGYSAALRTGFEAAQFDRVAFTDADCQFHLEDLALLVGLTEKHEIAVGYRIDRKDSPRRRFFSWGYNTLVRGLMGTRVRDLDCALKVFRGEALLNLLPESSGFFINTEMLTRSRQLGYAVAEAGVRHRPRAAGVSKVSLLDIPRTLRTLLPYWWSNVAFPGQVAQPDASRVIVPKWSRNVQFLGFVLLVAMAGLLFFSRLNVPLQEPEETRYAEIPRQMLESNSWLTPVYHGMSYYDKPPLLYWAVMGAYRLFGVHDWSARFVSSLAAFLCVLVTYLWGRKVAGASAGLLAGFILCLSARFVYLGRLLTMNSLLCLFVIAGLAAGHIALTSPRHRRGWWLASAVACGLGLLTKGPVALVLIGIPLLAFQLLDRRSARPNLRGWSLYVAIASLLAGPWFITVARIDPDFAGYFFLKHNLARYITPFDHAKPVWAYVPEVLAGMMPWSLLLIPFVYYLSKRSGPAARSRPASLGFAAIAFLWCFLFYSFSGSKRAGYILPAMPPLALALGIYLERSLKAALAAGVDSARGIAWGILAQRLCLLMFLIGMGGACMAGNEGIIKPRTAALAAGAAASGFAAIIVTRKLLQFRESWLLCGMTSFALLLAAVHIALPGYARKFAMRGQLRPLAELAQDHQIPVICYPRRWDSISFYLQRDDLRIYTTAERSKLVANLRENPQTLAFIKSDHSLDDLLADLPGSMEFVPCGRQGNVAVGLVRAKAEMPQVIYVQNQRDTGHLAMTEE